jgi:hypothetical protein
MPLIQHNPDGVFPPYRAYSHAIEVTADSRLLEPQWKLEVEAVAAR